MVYVCNNKVSNYSLYPNAEKGQQRNNVTENDGIKSYTSQAGVNTNGGIWSSEAADSGDENHHGIDTYNGRWKESILYTTASYNQSTRRTARQFGYLNSRRLSSPFADPD